MKFNYLTDDSEKSLAPFFSSITLSSTLYSVFIASGLVLLFWPWQDFANFMIKHQAPLTFFAIFTATLITNAYVNLRCGRGEMFTSHYFTGSGYYQEATTFEKENNFLQYGLIAFLLHTLLLLFPFLPLLILSTAMSGLPLTAFARAISIVFTASLLCRLFGFLMYLFRGRASLIGYLLARIFLIIFILVTAIVASEINPILPIYEMNRGLESIGLSLTSSYVLYMAAVISAISLLVIVNYLLVRRCIKIHSHESPSA